MVNNKGKNVHKLDANIRREEAKKNQHDVEPAEEFPVPEDYGDGSVIIFIWTTTHKRLLKMIVTQTDDDCWAWALVRILQFFCNKDISVVAQQISLSKKSLVKYVILGENVGKEPGAQKKLKNKSLAVSSLKRAIDYILKVGIERDYGTERNKIKAIFLTKPNATSEDILGLLVPHGLIGISVDVDDNFRGLKNEIYILHEPREGKKRHALIIIGYGRTKDNRLFFIVQNTWGTDWGINGYGRIIIEKTCPIFYVGELVK
ncbi:unnamed protein product [Eruca vesicaria subsp. sativa]|uniref:Peptidase C1A papain C-terminal domain-containing protein n=1 Tax=Eruca vesicaria subsp. sativa TaxID=29727 RepID=A0ABC8KRZ5_ERUVS|nr:unnamed protein product [Eruca vesicaria subsp. sativa]